MPSERDTISAAERAAVLASRAQMLSFTHMMAAHDFRDSLNSMTMNIELLSSTLEPGGAYHNRIEMQQRSLKALRQELRRVAQATSSAFEDSRIAEAETRRVAMAPLIESLMSTLRGIAHRQRATVHFVAPPSEVEVLGQADAIRHAIFNLALNGLEAMPEGGELTLSLGSEGQVAVIGVADTGPGIPDPLRDRVWELLFSTKPQRLGLGLHVVERIVAAHDGTVTLDVTESGAQFTMRLPLFR